ncbi:MAG TPA: hypothetical protein ENF46_01730 [Candidatus Acetothermia bacterium]|nr:hypothetical protein [Candidatus Acetothermia bacterium]
MGELQTEELKHQEALARLGFCNSLVQYTIALAGLVVAGLGGFFAAEKNLQNINFELTIATFLTIAGFVFEILNFLLAQEDRLIRKTNRELSSPITLPCPLTDGKFIFITFLGIGFPISAVLYLIDVKKLEWLLSVLPLMFCIANFFFFMLTLFVRITSLCAQKNSA